MPASPRTADTDPVGVDLPCLAGHLAAICDHAVVRLERGIEDEIDLALVLRDLRDVRDLLSVAAGGHTA